MNHATINRARRDLQDILDIRKANVNSLMGLYLDAIAMGDRAIIANYRNRVAAAQQHRYQARKALADFNKANS